MKIAASAGRSPKHDLREHCERLELRATFPDEPAWLAAIYRVLIFGGEIKISPKGDEYPTAIELPDPCE